MKATVQITGIDIAIDGSEIYKALWKLENHDNIHVYKSIFQIIYLKGENQKQGEKCINENVGA